VRRCCAFRLPRTGEGGIEELAGSQTRRKGQQRALESGLRALHAAQTPSLQVSPSLALYVWSATPCAKASPTDEATGHRCAAIKYGSQNGQPAAAILEPQAEPQRTWSASKARLEGYAGGSLISTGGHSLQRLLLVLDEPRLNALLSVLTWAVTHDVGMLPCAGWDPDASTWKCTYALSRH